MYSRMCIYSLVYEFMWRCSLVHHTCVQFVIYIYIVDTCSCWMSEDHPWDCCKLAATLRWSYFRDQYGTCKCGIAKKWSLFWGGRKVWNSTVFWHLKFYPGSLSSTCSRVLNCMNCKGSYLVDWCFYNHLIYGESQNVCGI